MKFLVTLAVAAVVLSAGLADARTSVTLTKGNPTDEVGMDLPTQVELEGEDLAVKYSALAEPFEGDADVQMPEVGDAVMPSPPEDVVGRSDLDDEVSGVIEWLADFFGVKGSAELTFEDENGDDVDEIHLHFGDPDAPEPRPGPPPPAHHHGKHPPGKHHHGKPCNSRPVHHSNDYPTTADEADDIERWFGQVFDAGWDSPVDPDLADSAHDEPLVIEGPPGAPAVHGVGSIQVLPDGTMIEREVTTDGRVVMHRVRVTGPGGPGPAEPWGPPAHPHWRPHHGRHGGGCPVVHAVSVGALAVLVLLLIGRMRRQRAQMLAALACRDRLCSRCAVSCRQCGGALDDDEKKPVATKDAKCGAGGYQAVSEEEA
ncbi:unnamed protein product [Pedinophyceae sp. YPF-701]|nr:unnamed protein product [Pedinophyceae sp. YPF-701]